jgi:hypothetical protein
VKNERKRGNVKGKKDKARIGEVARTPRRRLKNKGFESSVTAVLNKSYILENQPYALTEDATAFSHFLIILAGSFI